MGDSSVPAVIAPAAQAPLTLSMIFSIPKAPIYAAVASPAPVELIVLKSGGVISNVPSLLRSLAGRFEEVRSIQSTKPSLSSLFASSTSISSLLTTKKFILYSISSWYPA